MAGTGYFDNSTGVYRALSTETWDDYSSWTGFTEWEGTPALPLTFTTGVTDYGNSTLLNYLVELDISDPATVTVYYGDEIDSAGEIVSPSTVVSAPNTAVLNAVKGRYWQFEISITADSAGELLGPTISSITTSLSEETITRTLTDIDSSTLGGTLGAREIIGLPGISTVTSLVTQAQLTTGRYVADGYVADGYVETEFVFPVIRVQKGTPTTLYIVDGNNADLESQFIDCIFDAIVIGLPGLSSDALGNITQES